MSEPFLAEIRIFGFNFAPRNWAACDGQLLPIASNAALFSLLGTNFGGDGRTTFGLPDLRGRAALHEGPGYTLASRSGTESVVLSQSQMPAHTHVMQASSDNASANTVPGNVLARSTTPLYASPGASASLAPAAIGNGGGTVGHPNMMPFRTVNFCIALVGLFPSRS